MQAPAKNGSLFYNYKKSFSGILLAVCNADYEFTLIDMVNLVDRVTEVHFLTVIWVTQ